MKINQTSLIILTGMALLLNGTVRAKTDAANAPTHAPIPWDQIGAKAGADYHGDGLRVTTQGESVKLNCMFQRLEGEATPEGLWLTSTVTNQVQDRFRVVATALGRTGSKPLSRPDAHPLPTAWGEGRGEEATTSCCAASRPLARTGKVTVADQTVRYERPGLVEEYTVSMDGIRQDFVVLEKPLSRPDGHPLPTAWGEGRGEGCTASCDAVSRPLARTGTVTVADQAVRYERPGLVEEYTVSMDGVRQDFVVLEKPLSRPDGHPLPIGWGEGRGEGSGELRLELAVSGARVERTAAGAQLVLAESGRKIAYSRLRVTDATGKELPARIEVTGTATDSVFRTLNSALETPDSALALAILVDDAAAAYPIRIDPTFSDANWIVLNPSIPGADNAVYAAVVGGSGSLYIGGDFTLVGDVQANRIAKWDGSRWHALGAGMNNTVYALAVSGSDLYAGGAFTTAGDGAANCIAQWDGSRWSALGSGMGGLFPDVFALAVAGNGDLYAGGLFTTAGGVVANYIAKWDGNQWSALGAGMENSVGALAVSGFDLYAGGNFRTAGGVSAKYIARWDGSSWHALGSGVSGDVYALAVAGTNLYAGGRFTTAGDVTVNRIARWDGNSWSALGAGMNNGVYALAVAGTNLYAGGAFTTAGDVTVNRIARWDGNSWQALGSGVEGGSAHTVVDALAVSGSDLYAGGGFTTAGDVAANRIARWDGSSWQALSSGMNSQVNALAVSGSDLYAGGGFTTAGDVTANYVAKWNGSSWSALGSGMNREVYALAMSGTNLYAGGWFTTAGGVTANGIAKWNGSSWSALGSGIGGDSSFVSALAVAGTNLYAGGLFTTAGGITVSNIARWDGSNWSALGSGMTGDNPPAVSALAVAGNGDLYAGGQFTTAGGITVSNIARWDGNGWHALGTGMNNSVWALAVAGNGELYAGGWFTTAGGGTAEFIAQWDGSSWHALGSGMNASVSALAIADNGELYAGGSFTTAGDKISYYWAQAVLSPSLAPVPLQWQVSNQQLVLSWTNADFQLQAAPEVPGTYTNVPNATSPYTNLLTSPLRFFRLIAP